MKYKTAVRLAVRLIGLFLIAQALPWVLVGCGSLALDVFAGGLFGSSGLVSWQFRTTLVYSCSALVGLYLFFGGAWIVNRAIPSNRPYCPECGYETTGLPAEGICPECGTAYKQPTRPNPPSGP